MMTVVHKGEKADIIYLAERRKLSEKIGQRELWSMIDHWPLYVGIGNLGRFLQIYEIVKDQLDVPGHIAEFGSWRGANLMFMAKSMQILDPHGSKRVHCFDSFEGLPQFSDKDRSGDGDIGSYRGSMEELLDCISLYGLQDTIFIHKGSIEAAFPAYLKDDGGVTFSIIYFDADLYSPAVTVLSEGHSRLAKGGMFVFDEWNHPKWPGEGAAVRDFMATHGDFYEMKHIQGTRQPSLILRKIR